MKAFLIVMVLLIVVGIGVSFFLFSRRKAMGPVASTSQFNDMSKRLQEEWNNFVDLPVLQDCLMTSYSSCFPNVYFDSIGGNDTVTVKAGTGQEAVDVAGVRSILLADSYYAGSLLELDDVNGVGYVVDVMTGQAESAQLNPLLLSESGKLVVAALPTSSLNFSHSSSLKSELQTDPSLLSRLPTSLLRKLNTTNTLPQIWLSMSRELLKYATIFNSPPTAQSSVLSQMGPEQVAVKALFTNNKLSALQKAVVMYYFMHLTKQDYIRFIENFNQRIPVVGVFPLIYSAKDSLIGKGLQDGYLFCNLTKSVGVGCFHSQANLICYTESMDAFCGMKSYILRSIK